MTATTTLDCQLLYGGPQYVIFPLHQSQDVTIKHFGTKCGPNTGSSNAEEPHNIKLFETFIQNALSCNYYYGKMHALHPAVTMLYDITIIDLTILALIITDIAIFYRIWLMEPNLLCQLLYLRMLRFITLWHDYIANVQSIKLLSSQYLVINSILMITALMNVLDRICSIADTSCSIIYCLTKYTCLILLQIQRLKYKHIYTFISLVNLKNKDQHLIKLAPILSNKEQNIIIDQVGGGLPSLSLESILSFVPIQWQQEKCAKYSDWRFLDHIDFSNFTPDMTHDNILTLPCFIPLNVLQSHLTLKNATKIAKMHGLKKFHRMALKDLLDLLAQHKCSPKCQNMCTLISPLIKSKSMSSTDITNGVPKKKRLLHFHLKLLTKNLI